MKNIKGLLEAAVFAAIATIGTSSAALADIDEERKFGYSITITGTSDYIFRGISLNNNDPAFQPFIEFTYGTPSLTWYLDLWGSNVNDGLGDPWELDLYAGVRPVTGRISWDLGVLYYTNPSHQASTINPTNAGTDYVEFKIAATITPITNLSLTAVGYVTPDVGFASPVTETGEFDAAYTLPAWGIFTPTISGAIGYTHAERAGTFDAWCPSVHCDPSQINLGTDAYAYWNAGMKLTVDKYFMDFRYWDTSISKRDDQNGYADARFVFQAGVNLP